MRIVRTRTFDRTLKKLGASDADLEALFANIAARPQAGDVIPGSGGARKIRFTMKGKGKRGGGRAIYFAFVAEDTVYLLMAYGKNEKTDLSGADKKAVAAIIEELKNG